MGSVEQHRRVWSRLHRHFDRICWHFMPAASMNQDVIAPTALAGEQERANKLIGSRRDLRPPVLS